MHKTKYIIYSMALSLIAQKRGSVRSWLCGLGGGALGLISKALAGDETSSFHIEISLL